MLFLSGCISEIMEEPFIQDADNYEAEEIRTSSKGKIFIRGVDPDNQSYTKAWISSQNQSLIEETCSDKNWEVVWDCGITNTGLWSLKAK